MFDYIKGILISKNQPFAVVENNGIGYGILCNARTLSLLGDEGKEIKIYTKLIHKEDSMTLCGFCHREDRTIFDILTSVSGIGTKVAMCLLDEFSGSELIGAVIDEDYKLISRTKGVGAKMAQKIILELKDKLTSLNVTSEITAGKINEISKNISKETILEVQTVLQSLGYSSQEYTGALEISAKNSPKDDAQEILRQTLQILSTQQ
ncbi:TPA: Holliday junction branch migration protein RuvA [Candidatus Galligastranaerophilus faecipullorum]|nr:Holliday junction branch migration protein RuvA [Candidatus Galligastranaerophilus faecipullorum]